MIILGVILIILGALFDIGILYTLGGILAIIGLIFWLFGAFGRPLGPRTHYWYPTPTPTTPGNGPGVAHVVNRLFR